jgi:anaerobic selenocysteine-containing dehydrogenase
VPDIDRTDHLMILGANPIESNGSLATAPDWPGRLEALVARGGALVVVDPRRTKTADLATQHVPIRPGTDALLLAAMAGVLFDRGSVELGHLEGHVSGLEAVAGAVQRFTPAAVSEATGVPAAVIRSLAEDLADAPTAVVYGRIGTHTTPYGTVAAWLVDVLNLISGNLDRPGGAMFAKAAHEPAQRPARGFSIGRWSSRVHGHPEVMGELPAAVMADEITTEGDGRLRVLFTVAGNPVLTTPDAGSLEDALGRLDFMVSVDPYVNATTRHADVVLPPPSALERGHWDLAFQTLSMRDYVDWSPPVFDSDEPSEFQILVRLTAIASGLGADADPDDVALSALVQRVTAATADEASPIFGRNPGEIMDELAGRPVSDQLLDFMIRVGHRGDHFGSSPDGLTLARVAEHPHGLDLGPLSARLPAELSTETGTVEIGHPILVGDLDRLWNSLDGATRDRMVLVGRRQVRTANSWTHNVEVLVKGRNRCTLQIHPEDAARLGLGDGDDALVTSDVGSIELPADVTERIMPGVVSVPYGWGHGAEGTRQSVASKYAGVNVNILTPKVLDPLSGNAQLNGIPVRIERATLREAVKRET